ncbi:MAG: aminotransferase class III-fold pyridoxal phosphate-dependent enzyme, partial [Acidimicrobiia bacterium]|nr:aminotransferase class III-fold pyridoxal phosphate-dependent enzyme [Acidimicrobiia bacterium]
LSRLPYVKEVRGLGLLIAAELDGLDAREVAAECLREGLVINAVTPSALRLAPPLIIEESHIAAAVNKLSSSLDTVAERSEPSTD